MGWVGAIGAPLSEQENFVSIPERVWGGLERHAESPRAIAVKFQSLRGFGVGWSPRGGAGISWASLFQSLRGFGVGWSIAVSRFAMASLAFQSLRGFGVGWSAIAMRSVLVTLEFQSLRGFGVGWSQLLHRYPSSHGHVSIPERVWGGLEPSHPDRKGLSPVGFNP